MNIPSQSINKLARLRRISKLLDNAIAIPGTKFRFGLDPILGLLPGGGDTITGGISAYIVVEAARMGVPREILGKMVGNILIDSFAGTIPVIGDLFDVGWKSNVKNIELLEKHLDLTKFEGDKPNGMASQRPSPTLSDRLFIAGLILLLILIVVGFATIAFFTVTWFWNLVTNGLST